MTIIFPLTDLLATVPVEDQNFRLFSRQEFSRQASGVMRARSLGVSIWMMDCTTVALGFDEAFAIEAKLNALDGSIGTFEAGDLRRPFPRLHADGVFGDSATLMAVNANNKALRIENADAGFSISPGDYLMFTYGASRALHQAVEGAVADGSGDTPYFEVRPHIRPGWSLGTAVKFKRPTALFSLLPDSVQKSMQGGIHNVVSFKAVQYI